MSIHNIGAVETQQNIIKERRKLEGLAARRSARNQRLLDVRAMKYNNDATTLRQQRKANRQNKFQNKKKAMEEAAYEQAMNAAVRKYAMTEHIKEMKAKKQLEQYWKQQHRARATTNPEFDLNDPNALKKDNQAELAMMTHAVASLLYSCSKGRTLADRNV